MKSTASLRRLRRVSPWLIAGVQLLNAVNASPGAVALNEESMEYPLKLAFLHNFTKYVEWPSDSYKDSGDPLSICIVGKDPFSPGLEDELRTRKARNHPVEVKALKPGDTIRACHIVFIPWTAKAETDRVVKGLMGSNTLTVGETAGFIALGGIINFTVEQDRLHFEVNPLAAERAGLKISSKLLTIATIVKLDLGARQGQERPEGAPSGPSPQMFRARTR